MRGRSATEQTRHRLYVAIDTPAKRNITRAIRPNTDPFKLSSFIRKYCRLEQRKSKADNVAVPDFVLDAVRQLENVRRRGRPGVRGRAAVAAAAERAVLVDAAGSLRQENQGSGRGELSGSNCRRKPAGGALERWVESTMDVV